jgi:hypothetical protein
MMSLMQAFRIRSAYLFCNMAVVGLLPLTLNELYNKFSKKGPKVHFGLLHWVWVALSMPMIVEASTNVRQNSMRYSVMKHDSSFL